MAKQSSSREHKESSPSGPSIQFSKYHANGNDFIILDNTTGEHDDLLEDASFIRALCKRNTGVGSDGLVEIKKPQGYVFQMVFYLACGAQGSFEGNAARCTLAYLYDTHVIPDEITFLGSDGLHHGFYNEEKGQALVGFGDLADPLVLSYDEFYFDTGSPHHIIFLPDVETLEGYNVVQVGQVISEKVQYRATAGTNVHFVAVDESSGGIRIRTYDRGVRSEVMSSGSGAVACALVYEVRCHRMDEIAGFSLQGVKKVGMRELDRALGVGCLFGKVEVRYRHARGSDIFRSVFLKGPVWHVMDGEFYIPQQKADLIPTEPTKPTKKSNLKKKRSKKR